MGAASSINNYSVEHEIEIYKDVISLYENEMKNKLKSGEIDNKKCLEVLKDRYQSKIDLSPVASNSVPTESIEVGAVVKCKVDGLFCEGVVTELDAETKQALVDFGSNSIVSVSVHDCILVLAAIHFEVGDAIKVNLDGAENYVSGRITVCNLDGTFDILLRAKGKGTVQNIKFEQIKKLALSRDVATGKWKKASRAIRVLRHFIHIGGHFKRLGETDEEVAVTGDTSEKVSAEQ